MTERDFPDPSIPQDPGIPGADVVSDPRDRPIPDEKDEDAERREHPESDDEGHMTPPRESADRGCGSAPAKATRRRPRARIGQTRQVSSRPDPL